MTDWQTISSLLVSRWTPTQATEERRATPARTSWTLPAWAAKGRLLHRLTRARTAAGLSRSVLRVEFAYSRWGA